LAASSIQASGVASVGPVPSTSSPDWLNDVDDLSIEKFDGLSHSKFRSAFLNRRWRLWAADGAVPPHSVGSRNLTATAQNSSRTSAPAA